MNVICARAHFRTRCRRLMAFAASWALVVALTLGAAMGKESVISSPHNLSKTGGKGKIGSLRRGGADMRFLPRPPQRQSFRTIMEP